MAIVTTVTPSAGTSWEKKETDPNDVNVFFDDKGQYQYVKNFEDGSGNNSVNTFFHERIALTSGADRTIDLQSLTTNLFGTSITITLTGVKQVFLQNTATGVGQNLHLLSTGTNSNSNIFNGSGNFIVYPNSVFHITNFVSGWPITNTTNNIILRNAGNALTTGNFFLAGTSG